MELVHQRAAKKKKKKGLHCLLWPEQVCFRKNLILLSLMVGMLYKTDKNFSYVVL